MLHGKKYNQITLAERALIQTQLQEGLSPASIAASLGRHRSSITRELARNGWKATPDVRPVGRPPSVGGYSCNQANILSSHLCDAQRQAAHGDDCFVALWS
jgi:IS30 family transposase